MGKLTRAEIETALARWQGAWNSYDLEGVMALFHDEILFVNWTGARVEGKNNLRRAWTPWFSDHGGFRFIEEESFIDVEAQKVLYRWRLEWPSPEKGYEGRPEVRRGVDVMQFQDGLIIRKLTFAQTVIEIEGQRVALRPVAG